MPDPPRIVPTRPGVLVLMNHQSLYDIPLVVQTIAGGYPRIVTRERYAARWIPLISYMVRLYQYPVVDPTANRDEMRRSLEALTHAARTTDVPLVVFPEGTRTRDGEIAPFKRGGMGRILAARPWTVYVFVADGFWTAARLQGFAANLPHIDGRIELVATMEWTDTSGDANAFLDEVREMMVKRLAEMRGGAPVA